jgi:hypothetical protein
MKTRMLVCVCLSLMMGCSGEPLEAGDETESVGAQESALVAAERTARLDGLAAVFRGDTASIVRQRLFPNVPDASLTVDQLNYVNALWDFQKGSTGIANGVVAKGAARRGNMASGSRRVQGLLTECRGDSTLKAKTYVLERDITKIFVLAKQEAEPAAPIVPFFVYSKNVTAAQRATLNASLQRIAPFLGKIPGAHADRLDPIFIVDQLPGGRLTGGGYFRPNAVSQWLGKKGSGVPSANNIATNVADADINDFALQRNRGIIALTTEAMLKNIAEFTLVHESGHSVNNNYAAIQPSNHPVEPHYAGLKYPRVKCAANAPPGCLPKLAPVAEYAAEAYARYFINRKVCRAVGDADPPRPAGESDAACNARIIAVMDQAPAFQSPVVFPVPLNVGLPALSLDDLDRQDHLEDFELDESTDDVIE